MHNYLCKTSSLIIRFNSALITVIKVQYYYDKSQYYDWKHHAPCHLSCVQQNFFFHVSTCFVQRMCQFVELVCFKSIYVNRYICPSIRTCEIFSLLLIKFVLMSWIFFAQNMTNASTMNTAAAPRQYVSTYLGLTCITKRRKSCCFWCVGQT